MILLASKFAGAVLFICFINNFLYSQEIPSSTRSQQAIARVKPQLERDLQDVGLTLGQPVFIRIFKKEMELEIWVQQDESNGYKLFKSYNICSIGRAPLGPKLEEDDKLVPEGFYFFRPIDMNPFSNFHLSFNIGYPNQYDRYHGCTGSAIMVHGECVSVGCFAMTNRRIEQIYAIVDAAFRGGQPFIRIHIFPFMMTERNLQRYHRNEWHSFWLNLKEGYDAFENNGFKPPNVRVSNGRYTFD